MITNEPASNAGNRRMVFRTIRSSKVITPESKSNSGNELLGQKNGVDHGVGHLWPLPMTVELFLLSFFPPCIFVARFQQMSRVLHRRREDHDVAFVRMAKRMPAAMTALAQGPFLRCGGACAGHRGREGGRCYDRGQVMRAAWPLTCCSCVCHPRFF